MCVSQSHEIYYQYTQKKFINTELYAFDFEIVNKIIDGEMFLQALSPNNGIIFIH